MEPHLLLAPWDCLPFGQFTFNTVIMNSDRPGLLIIDVQQGFEDSQWGTRNNPDAEQHIEQLLRYWRAHQLPVFHVQHASRSEESPPHPSRPGFAIKEPFRPREDEPLIQKKVNAAFIGTNLQEILQENDIETLVIVGLTTNHCVSTTARMAGNLGFESYLISDATAAFDRTSHTGTYYSARQIHDISLANIHGEFATVCDTSEILHMLDSPERVLK